MSELTTFTARLACPTCSKPADRTVAIVRVDAHEWRARLHECTSCWHRRARALGHAREKLRAAGLLGDSDCGPTWLGAVARDEDRPAPRFAESSQPHDALLGAMLSELWRQGIPPARDGVMRLDAESLGLLETARVA